MPCQLFPRLDVPIPIYTFVGEFIVVALVMKMGFLEMGNIFLDSFSYVLKFPGSEDWSEEILFIRFPEEVVRGVQKRDSSFCKD